MHKCALTDAVYCSCYTVQMGGNSTSCDSKWTSIYSRLIGRMEENDKEVAAMIYIYLC